MIAVVELARSTFRATAPFALIVAVLFTSAAEVEGSSAEGRMIEEIIVTAQKREESLQETPISVTAFTAEAIEALGFRQSVDITAQTPNYSVGYPNGDTGVPAPFIRGVGLNDFGVLNQGPIASYLDETYISSNAAQIFQLLDVERVEVLRGPQGTLYGRNATGGAVNFVSRKPTNESNGMLRAGLGSWGTRKFEAAYGAPISDTAAYRAAVLKTDSDGWLKNRFTGNDQNGIDEFAWRLLVETQPSDAWDLLLNMHGGATKSDAVQYRHLGVWDAEGNMCSNADILAGLCADIFGYSEEASYTTLTGVSAPATPGYDEGNYDFEATNDTSFWGISLTVDWSLNDYLITSITSFDEVDDFRPEETDDGPNDILTGELAVDHRAFRKNYGSAAGTIKERGLPVFTTSVMRQRTIRHLTYCVLSVLSRSAMMSTARLQRVTQADSAPNNSYLKLRLAPNKTLRVTPFSSIRPFSSQIGGSCRLVCATRMKISNTIAISSSMNLNPGTQCKPVFPRRAVTISTMCLDGSCWTRI